MTVTFAEAFEKRMNAVEGIALRRATLDDATTIARQRCSMFRDMGCRDEGALDAMMQRFLPWVEAKIASGDYLAWLAVSSGDLVVAGAGLWLMDWPAHMVGSGTHRGNILNVYTEPEFRHRGLARWLIEASLHWCRANEVDLVILHSSPQGQRLYESLGFQAGNEMRIQL